MAKGDGGLPDPIIRCVRIVTSGPIQPADLFEIFTRAAALRTPAMETQTMSHSARPRRSNLLVSLPLLLLLLPTAPAAWGAEARLLTLDDITALDGITALGGTDFDGGVGDYLLKSDRVEAVLLALGATPDFGIPFAPEVLPSRGVLIDVGTPGARNDQLNEIHQVLNISPTSLVLYGGAAEGLPDPIFSNDGDTASITVFGIALLEGVSSPSAPTLFAQTTYSVTDGEPWIRLETTITNGGPDPVPVFTIGDADILPQHGRLPFQPFPDRGARVPPLDVTAPFSALGVWPFVATPGNNGPEDTPDGLDGAVGEVCYAFLAPSVGEPLVGVASELVVLASSFFDLAAVGAGTPPLLGVGESMTHTRRLVVAEGNSVEACADVALPELFTPLFGFDARVPVIGRVVVDGAADRPLEDVHLFFDNTFPGAPDLSPLVTVVDDNNDGVPDGVLPAIAGAPWPMTHVEVDASGAFSARLQILVDPTVAATTWRGRLYAPNQEPLEIGPIVLDAAALLSGATLDLGEIVLPGKAELTVDVERVFPGGGRRAIPAKLAIYGRNGTPNPDFGSQYLGLGRFPGLSRADGDGGDPLTAGNTNFLSNTLNGSEALHFAFSPDGSFDLDLRPGDYTVYASRGLEYDIAVADFTVAAGEAAHLNLGLRRVVTTEGFVSLGAHIHSARSFDSSVSLADRVTTFAAAGVEYIVSTDHDMITDFAPVIDALGLGREISSVIGTELTGGLPVPSSVTGGIDVFPDSIGHWNAWPLTAVPGNRRNGSPQDEYIGAATAIDRLRGMDSLALLGATPDTAGIGEWLAAAQAGEAGTPGEMLPPDDEIVMLNHPRAGLAGLVVIGMFNNLANPGGDPNTGGFDPDLPLDAFPNSLLFLPSLYNKAVVGPAGTDTTALSFDAMEIINGPDTNNYLAVRRDWFSLLNQGIHKTGFAVSDSHRPVMENAGFGRTYVAYDPDAPGAFNGDHLTQNIRDLHAFGTTGPVIRFEIPSDFSTSKGFDRFFDGIGQTAVSTTDQITLRIRVEAAQWIPVEEVRIFKNGALVETLAVSEGRVLGGPSLRLQRNLKIDGGDADAWYVVEAGVRLDDNGDPVDPSLLETARRVEPGLVPIAFTNPIFVDRQGDGYTPPGLNR